MTPPQVRLSPDGRTAIKVRPDLDPDKWLLCWVEESGVQLMIMSDADVSSWPEYGAPA